MTVYAHPEHGGEGIPICPCTYRMTTNADGVTWCDLCAHSRVMNGENWCWANFVRAPADFAWCDYDPSRVPSLWEPMRTA